MVSMMNRITGKPNWDQEVLMALSLINEAKKLVMLEIWLS